MKEVSETGHFTIDLPSDAMLSGPGNSWKVWVYRSFFNYKRLTTWNERSNIKDWESISIVELTRPIWEQGLEVPEVDLRPPESWESHLHMQNLGKSAVQRGRYLRPRTIAKRICWSINLTFAIGQAGLVNILLLFAHKTLNEKNRNYPN